MANYSVPPARPLSEAKLQKDLDYAGAKLVEQQRRSAELAEKLARSEAKLREANATAIKSAVTTSPGKPLARGSSLRNSSSVTPVAIGRAASPVRGAALVSLAEDVSKVTSLESELKKERDAVVGLTASQRQAAHETMVLELRICTISEEFDEMQQKYVDAVAALQAAQAELVDSKRGLDALQAELEIRRLNTADENAQATIAQMQMTISSMQATADGLQHYNTHALSSAQASITTLQAELLLNAQCSEKAVAEAQQVMQIRHYEASEKAVADAQQVIEASEKAVADAQQVVETRHNVATQFMTEAMADLEALMQAQQTELESVRTNLTLVKKESAEWHQRNEVIQGELDALNGNF